MLQSLIVLSNLAKINRLRTLKQSKSWLNTEQLTSVLMELRAPSLNISPAIDSAFIWSPRLIGWALTQQRSQPRTCDNVSDNEETDVVWLVSGIVLRAAKPATNCDMSPTIHDHLSLRPHHPFFINLSSHTRVWLLFFTIILCWSVSVNNELAHWEQCSKSKSHKGIFKHFWCKQLFQHFLSVFSLTFIHKT